MSALEASVIVIVDNDTSFLAPTIDSIRGQTVAAEIVVVTTSERLHRTRSGFRDVDMLVGVPSTHWTAGRALNTGCAAAATSIHATVALGRKLSRRDWIERLLAHLARPEVMAASGARFDRAHQLLLEPQDVRATNWSETFNFSTAAGGWKAAAWRRCPFPEMARGAEDRLWGWRVVSVGGVLVVDPFLHPAGSPIRPVGAWTIFRRTADEWAGLLASGAPVHAPTLREALAMWWSDIDDASATPAALQRLNYYSLARAIGRWVGGRSTARQPSR